VLVDDGVWIVVALFERIGSDPQVRFLLSIWGDDSQFGIVFDSPCSVALDRLCQALGVES
jgi:hypothetical protein